MRAGRGGRYRDRAPFHRGIGPSETAAREHRNADVVRRNVPGYANVVTLRANVGDRGHSDAEIEIEVFLDPGRGLGDRLASEGRIGGRHRKARAVATENKREVAVLQRICDRSDHRSARHVHGLVAVLADCLGRLLHIGHAHHPIVRHWREAGFIRDMGKVAKDGQIFVEIAGGFECIHVARATPIISAACVVAVAWRLDCSLQSLPPFSAMFHVIL